MSARVQSHCFEFLIFPWVSPMYTWEIYANKLLLMFLLWICFLLRRSQPRTQKSRETLFFLLYPNYIPFISVITCQRWHPTLEPWACSPCLLNILVLVNNILSQHLCSYPQHLPGPPGLIGTGVLLHLLFALPRVRSMPDPKSIGLGPLSAGTWLCTDPNIFQGTLLLGSNYLSS